MVDTTEDAPAQPAIFEAVKAELGNGYYPDPADMLDGLSIQAGLFYAEQLVYAVLGVYTNLATESSEDGGEVPDDVPRVLEAIGNAAGSLDAACVLMNVLPDEAVPG